MNNQGLGVPGAVHPGFLFPQLIARCRSPMFSTKGDVRHYRSTPKRHSSGTLPPQIAFTRNNPRHERR